jgi:hypothetical protein
VARDPIDIELEEPVQAHGETITSLRLRPPSGKDLIEAGWPFSTERTARGGVVVDVVQWSAARTLLSGMAQVPASTIDALTASDKYMAVEAIKYFFLWRIQARSSPTSSNGESGLAA